MNSDRHVLAELDHYLPQPDPGQRDWNDVLVRAGLAAGSLSSRTRKIAFATALAAALVVALPVSAFVFAGDRFSSWLNGHPGNAVSHQTEIRFRAGIAGWAGYARIEQLRRLVAVQTGSTSFVLYGFRVGDEICLRVTSSGASPSGATGCAPLRELAHPMSAVVPVIVDYRVAVEARNSKRQTVSLSFGLAADGVSAVNFVTATGHSRPAVVASGAFLSANILRSADVTIVRVDALTPHGLEQRALPAVPHGLSPSANHERLLLLAPAKIQHRLSAGIAWFTGHKQDGEPVPSSLLAGLPVHPRFARLLHPDPLSPASVIVSEGTLLGAPVAGNKVCVSLAVADVNGGGCNPGSAIFQDGPIFASQLAVSGSDAYESVFGIVADGVTSLDAYLGSGERIAAPLADNAFVLELARAAFPCRLVARDAAGNVVGITDLNSDALTPK